LTTPATSSDQTAIRRERAKALAKRLVGEGLELFATSMDATLVQNSHRLQRGTAEENRTARKRVSEDLFALIRALLVAGIRVAVVTHGDNNYCAPLFQDRERTARPGAELEFVCGDDFVNRVFDEHTGQDGFLAKHGIPCLARSPQLHSQVDEYTALNLSEPMPESKEWHLKRAQELTGVENRAAVMLVDDLDGNLRVAKQSGYRVCAVNNVGNFTGFRFEDLDHAWLGAATG